MQSVRALAHQEHAIENTENVSKSCMTTYLNFSLVLTSNNIVNYYLAS